MKLKILVVFFVSLLLSLRAHCFASNEVKEKINKIPQEEQERLSCFFEELIANDCFGYTIFGDKPASLSGYFTQTTSGGLVLRVRNSLFLQDGRKLWGKYGSIFQIKNFIFKFQTNSDQTWNLIYLINKQSFLDAVKKHLHLFQQVLGQQVTAEKLLEEISKEETTVEKVLDYHEGLKGIILGYGSRNSFLFQRRHKVVQAIHTTYPFPYAPPESLNLLSEKEKVLLFKESKGVQESKPIYRITHFMNFFDEYKYLQTVLQSSAQETEPLSFFQLPTFVADHNDSETKELKEKYVRVRKKMAQAYSQGDFLEVTLCAMTEK